MVYLALVFIYIINVRNQTEYYFATEKALQRNKTIVKVKNFI